MYRIPRGRHRVEEVVQRSRFITTLGHAEDEASARSFIDAVRAEFPDATHHCWAYVAGPPGETAHIGMSDDGEPHGTAGRPMLTTLLHSEVGEVVAVVTRYFGGVKLGKGGLGRAYAGGVKLALDSLPTRERVVRVPVEIRVPFAAADSLFRLVEELGLVDRSESYATGLELSGLLPEDAVERLRQEVAGFTGGKGSVTVRPGSDPPLNSGG